MRVITGSARGKKLTTLPGDDVRPTADRIKEALFSSIHFEIEGSTVLDLFAGSGQLGIEALSRGAAYAVFCDKMPDAVNTVKKNLAACEFSKETYEVNNTDFLGFLSRTNKKFDFCFLDPPYEAGYYEDALNGLSGVMKNGGVVFCEHPVDVKLNDGYGKFKKIKDYRFSRILISKYVLEGAVNEP